MEISKNMVVIIPFIAFSMGALDSAWIQKREAVTDCYQTVLRDGSPSSVTIDLVGNTPTCTVANGQINNTGIFTGTPIESNQCPGTSFFCCAKKNAVNQITAIYCRNIP